MSHNKRLQQLSHTVSVSSDHKPGGGQNKIIDQKQGETLIIVCLRPHSDLNSVVAVFLLRLRFTHRITCLFIDYSKAQSKVGSKDQIGEIV